MLTVKLTHTSNYLLPINDYPPIYYYQQFQDRKHPLKFPNKNEIKYFIYKHVNQRKARFPLLRNYVNNLKKTHRNNLDSH